MLITFQIVITLRYNINDKMISVSTFNCFGLLCYITIEQALKDKGFNNLYDEGYQVAFSVAFDNLKNGLTVVADSTNPVDESRIAWRKIAKDANVGFTEIEVICSDKDEHRKRVESRQSDIPNLVQPSWESVIGREYAPWVSADIVIDTAVKTPEQSKADLLQLLSIQTCAFTY